MGPYSVMAVIPFRFLDLPREVRDNIYEATIFDFSPPDILLDFPDPDSVRFQKMNTNILLANRRAYWEARDVIVRRAQLVRISSSRPGAGDLSDLVAFCGLIGIDPISRNLCVMIHHSTYQDFAYLFL